MKPSAIDSLFLYHLDMTYEEFKRLPDIQTICEKHFSLDCVECKKMKENVYEHGSIFCL